MELAQLQYTQPRLTGKNRAMDRLAGGIGGRGPGETKLETDRRKVRERIARIKQDLKALRTQRGFTRGRRAKARVPVASLVGYTNAGKSTLLNTLTNADVLAEDSCLPRWTPQPADCAFRRNANSSSPTRWVSSARCPRNSKRHSGPLLKNWKPLICCCMWPMPDTPSWKCSSRAVEEILDELELQGYSAASGAQQMGNAGR